VTASFFREPLALTLTALVVVSSCSERATDEQLILKVLDEGVAALEERDVARAKKVLADDYEDASKRKKQAMAQLAFFATQRGPIAISLRNIMVAIDGAQASVTLNALALQGRAEMLDMRELKDLLPERGRDFKLTLTLAKRDGAWLVTAIDGDGMSASALE
jgi:hypothetical protein